jgi:glycosyl transferase family 87/dolichyl-phosphate-mannose-protein mannosyltransferase
VAFLAAKWRTLEAWVGSRGSAAALFLLALAVFALESAFLPAYPGRDMSRYLQTFFQLGYHVPLYPQVLNTRGPISAIGVAVPLELGGWVVEVWLALLYAFSVVAWSKIALIFGSRAALLTSGLLLVTPGYGILFHQLASDSLFAAAFAAWALVLSRALQAPSCKTFAFAGVLLGVLVLVRPANQVLLVMAAVPLVLRAPWRDRLAWAAAFFIPALVVAQSWKIYATLRWGNVVGLKPSTGLFALALVLVPALLRPPWRARALLLLVPLIVLAVTIKGIPGESPSGYVRSIVRNESNQFLYRSFELDRIMAPENGPASRRLAGVVKRELLGREPYRSYGVDVHEFFASGSDRVFGDLTGVAPAADLAGATREAIRRHPGAFLSSIARTLWDQLANRPVYAPEVALASPSQPDVAAGGRQLPQPTEGQLIPASRIGPLLWTPGGRAYEVWTSPTEHHFVFTNPKDKRRYDKLGADVERLSVRIPTRDSAHGVIHRANQASHRFPPLALWLLLGVVALAFRRPRNALVAIAPAAAGLVVIVATALVAPAVPEYAAPVSPAFILLAAAGLLGVPVRRDRAEVAADPRALAGVVVGVVAALWALRICVDTFRFYADGGVPKDLEVFRSAAAHVTHFASPYAYAADQTFAYPPLLAWLVAPLQPLGMTAAAIIWAIVSFGAIGLALWWLELRDWRCYALVGVFMFTRSAVSLGTVEPLLLLAVAAAWRWRDCVFEPAAAVGLAIVLKLFLWPLAVWLALTRRFRAALLAVVVAVIAAAVSWAAIGFAGVGSYPGVLRRLANDESSSSYSVVALGVRAHMPLLAARIVSVLVALSLLAATAWLARNSRLTQRDRDVATFTLCLAAAFAASPIVWVHYFLLLLVPLVLARPRLSLLWLVPLAYQPLGATAWPAGDGRKLGLALAATLLILGAAVLRVEWRPVLRRTPRLRLSSR